MNKTERDIMVALVSHRAFQTRYQIMVPNCYNTKYLDNEADVFGIRRSLYADEFEIKVSRSDLLKDKHKMVKCGDYPNIQILPKYDALLQNHIPVNYFWYVLAEGIGTVDDIPEFAGLITVSEKGVVKTIRHPKKLCKVKMSYEEAYRFSRKIYFRYLPHLITDERISTAV